VVRASFLFFFLNFLFIAVQSMVPLSRPSMKVVAYVSPSARVTMSEPVCTMADKRPYWPHIGAAQRGQFVRWYSHCLSGPPLL
jgi:hypothetical protein